VASTMSGSGSGSSARSGAVPDARSGASAASPALQGRRRAANSYLTPAVAARALGAVVIVTGAIFAVRSVHGHGAYAAAMRWAITFWAVIVVVSWLLVELNLHPLRKPRAGHNTGPRS
jgi:hypothetical protein